MKLSPIERRIAMALLAGPKTPEQLLNLSKSASLDTVRTHVSRLRSKLTTGSGIETTVRYALTGGAADALRTALDDWGAA